MKFQRGLVVGKFAPLHRGHELLIRTAQEQCAELIVLSYSNPEFPGCEPERRAAWIAELFPAVKQLVVTDELLRERWAVSATPPPNLPPNDAPASVHRKFVARLCRELLGVTVDAVFTSEEYGEGFAEELTREFRVSEASLRAVQHVMVDQARQQVPISGSQIRADVHAHRAWLPPAVYASFVQRVCVLGAESTGKSTLVTALAERFDTCFVPEFGRELWVEKNGQLDFADMLSIGERQVALECQALRTANRFLFCDTSPLTTLFFSHVLFGRADPLLEQLAEREYDVYVLCDLDVPFVQDGTRQELQLRERHHTFYIDQLQRWGRTWITVRGSVEERVQELTRRLSGSA